MPDELQRPAGLEKVLGLVRATKLTAALQAVLEWCHGTGPLYQADDPDAVPYVGTEEARRAVLDVREMVRTGLVAPEQFRAMVCFVRAVEESVEIVNPGDLEGGGPKILGPGGEEVH